MTTTACPCDVFVHPRIISNLSGRASIDYRVGDYTAFRHALLRSRPGESALAQWHATGDGDLALQLLEWWAYLADILTFYNERAIQQALLRTAVPPGDIRRIIRLLGYRPRPGIGATGVVAALTDSSRPFVLAHGFPIQATSGAGKPPQVFELDEDVEIGLLGRLLPPSARFPTLSGGENTSSGTSSGVALGTWSGHARRKSGKLRNSVPARLKKRPLRVEAGKPAVVGISGVVTLLRPGDTVLFLKRTWNGMPVTFEQGVPEPDFVLAVVDKVQPTWDELGRAVTALTLHPGGTLPGAPPHEQYRMLKPTKLAHLWLYHERYPGMKTVTPAGVVLQALETFFDPGGFVTGGMSKEPPQDPHVLTSLVAPGPPGPPGSAHLEAITRGLSPGDPVLFEQRVVANGFFDLVEQMMRSVSANVVADLVKKLGKITFLTKVMDYSELIWFANPPEGDRIGQGPPIGPPSQGLLSKGAGPIPIPHSCIRFNDPAGIASLMAGPEDLNIGTIVVHYGWQEVGELVEAPAENATTEAPTEGQNEPHPPPEVPTPPDVPPATPLQVLIEDTTGAGVHGWIGVTNPEGGPPLVPPLQALLNLLPVSRGQTVAREILGSGDSILINQEFTLARWPLTYLTGTGARSTNGYVSTLRVRVDGVEWHEVPTFYGQPANARVFVTREDDEQKTHVRFGDGEFGARLPSGVDNVVATYRYGSGAEVPRIGTLTTILRPQEGLQSIRNPIAPGGGADPDPPAHIRRYAPRSVLTFGRAVSGDDYETIAAQTPGVSRACVRWTWDADAQRTMVKVFVGDDEAAVVAARDALRAFADPNRPVVVERAAPRYAHLSFTLEIDPDYLPDAVSAAVLASLLDPQRKPFGTDVVRIDDVVYDSEIYDICMSVPGVVAVHGLEFGTVQTVSGTPQQPPPGFPSASTLWDTVPLIETLVLETGERHSPGEGRFYLLRDDCVRISTEMARHGR